MKDVFLATDELSKLKIQTIVPTAEQSEQVTPLATQKAACSPNSVGLASPTAKASQRGEGEPEEGDQLAERAAPQPARRGTARD